MRNVYTICTLNKKIPQFIDRPSTRVYLKNSFPSSENDWLVTALYSARGSKKFNTKFVDEAMEYAACMPIKKV